MSKSKPIAEQLRKLIAQAERRGITRYQLAKLSGVTEAQLSRLVHGEVDPRLATAERIAKALGYQIRFVER
jgi:transcriptional regulator with XRE-family HTH domain